MADVQNPITAPMGTDGEPVESVSVAIEEEIGDDTNSTGDAHLPQNNETHAQDELEDDHETNTEGRAETAGNGDVSGMPAEHKAVGDEVKDAALNGDAKPTADPVKTVKKTADSSKVPPGKTTTAPSVKKVRRVHRAFCRTTNLSPLDCQFWHVRFRICQALTCPI